MATGKFRTRVSRFHMCQKVTLCVLCSLLRGAYGLRNCSSANYASRQQALCLTLLHLTLLLKPMPSQVLP